MKNLLSSSTLRTALVLGIAATSAAAQSLLGSYGEVLLAAGDNVPGLPGFTVYSTNSSIGGSPVIDQNGTVLFQVRMLPAGIDDRAIFIGRNGSDLQLVVQSNTQAPGLPAGTLLNSSSTSSGSGLEDDPIISPFNEILYFGSSVYDAAIPTPTTADSAAFWGPAGGIQLLAREGDPVPGLAGELWGSMSFSRQYNKINGNGNVAFKHTLQGATTTTDDCLVTGLPGVLTIVAREGDQVPGLPSGLFWAPASNGTFSFIISINENDEIVFSPKVSGASVTTADDYVMASYLAGNVSIWAREGDQAPGMAPGIVLFGTPAANGGSWNKSGNMAIGWNIDDGGATITTINDGVIWYGGAAGLSMAVREGDPTGLPAGEQFGVFNNTSIKSNAQGQIAFFTSLRDSTGGALPTTSDSTMVIGTPGNWTFIVREGDAVPAIPPSVNGPWVCGSVNGSTNFNGRGQLLFNQSCNDGVATVSFQLCYDPTVGLLVVQDDTESITTTLRSGNVTSLSNAGTLSSSDDSSMWFNNAGDFAARASIDGGVQAAFLRGHAGTLYGTPASIDGSTGGTQSFDIKGGAIGSNNLYIIVGSQTGTRPGTVLPGFGSPTIPLNFDAWTSLSISLANSPIYANSLWFTDPSGNASASFNLPGGLGLNGTLLHHAVIGLDINLMTTFVSEPVSLKIN